MGLHRVFISTRICWDAARAFPGSWCLLGWKGSHGVLGHKGVRILLPRAVPGWSLSGEGLQRHQASAPACWKAAMGSGHLAEVPKAAQAPGTCWPRCHQLCPVPALWEHRGNNQGAAEEHPAPPCACCSPALTRSLGKDRLPAFSLPSPPFSRAAGAWQRAPPKPVLKWQRQHPEGCQEHGWGGRMDEHF